MSKKHDKQKQYSFDGSQKSMQRIRTLKECYEEAKRVEISSGGGVVKRQKMDVRSFRAQFRPKGIVVSSGASQRKDDDTARAVIQLSASKLRKQREKEGNDSVRELANHRERECLKRFEDGAISSGRLVSCSRSCVDVGEAELSNSRIKGSNTDGSSKPPGMKPSVTRNVLGETLTDNTCFGAEVLPEIKIVDSDSIEASTNFNVLKKSNQSIDSKNLDPLCNLVRKRQKVVDNGVNPSHGEELNADRGILHANQSSPVPALGGCTSSPSPASNSHDNISLPERNQDLSVESLISNEHNSIHFSWTAQMANKCELIALKSLEEKKLLLEKKKSVESAVIRQIHSRNVVMRVQKLKMLDYETSQKLEEHKKLIEAGLKDLKSKHHEGIIEDREIEAQWLAQCQGTENRTSDEVPICNFPARGHARNKVVNDSHSCYATVSDFPVKAVGCTTHMESDCLQGEHFNDSYTSDGLKSHTTVHELVDAVACNIPAQTICTLSKSVNNLHSKDDNLLDVCVDSATAAEGCAVRKEIENAPGIPTSEGIEVTVTERISVSMDEQPNEVAFPSYSPAKDKKFKHPRFDGEAHVKLPSASDIVQHHYIQRASHEERLDKLSLCEANEAVPVPENSLKKLRSTNDLNMNTTVLQANGANDAEDRVISSGTPDLLGNQRDDVDGTDPSPGQTTLVSHPHEASTDELPQCASEDRPNQDKLSQLVESIESENLVQVVTTSDLTTGAASSAVADNGMAAEPNYTTGFEQRQPSTEHVTSGAALGGPAYQMFNERCEPLRATETTYQVEEPPNHSQHQPQVRENLFDPSSSDIRNSDICNIWHSLASISNQGGEPTSRVCASAHHVGQPSVVDGGSTQRISWAVIQAANQLGLSNSHLRLQADPLQIEVEMLCKGIEQTTKDHEDLKSQLRSDYEKEIAEVVSEIRCKYEAQVQDAEVVFQQKQKDLDTNVNKVLLNKILAVAFSTKWLDDSWRQKGSIQQRQHRSVDPTPESANVGLSSAGSTPAATQNTSLDLLSGPRATSLSVGASSTLPIIRPIFRPQPNAPVEADIRAVAPHLRSVRSEFRATAPHLQVAGADIRVDAPHLQPFKPPVSAPCHSLPHSMTNNH